MFSGRRDQADPKNFAIGAAGHDFIALFAKLLYIYKDERTHRLYEHCPSCFFAQSDRQIERLTEDCFPANLYILTEEGFLEQSPSESKKSIAELKGLLQSLSTQEQMRLPEVLSKLAVERLYPIMRELELEPALQEHLIWGYFREKMSGVLVISDELMAEILQQHRDSQRIVAESLILTAIKEEKISLEQLQAIRRFFERNELLNRKPFEKETLAFVCREKVRSGNALQQQEVEQLLEAEAFSTVLFALQENKVETAALKLIQPPAAGEKNRKRKQAVFDRAQRQAKHN